MATTQLTSRAAVNRSVLLVDDEVLLLRALERGLRSRYDLVLAKDAREAVGHLEARHFDAVVSDDRCRDAWGATCCARWANAGRAQCESS
jgi:DNA-binding NtrC family response regulator